MTVVLAGLTLDRCKKKAVRSGTRLSIFGQERASCACLSNAQVTTAPGSQRLAEQAIWSNMSTFRNSLGFVGTLHVSAASRGQCWTVRCNGFLKRIMENACRATDRSRPLVRKRLFWCSCAARRNGSGLHCFGPTSISSGRQ